MIKVSGNEIYISTEMGNVIRIELQKVEAQPVLKMERPAAPSQLYKTPWREILRQLSQN